MRVDIYPLNDSTYRGVDRLLSAEQFLPKTGLNGILDQYYAYLECLESSEDEPVIFNNILPFYRSLTEKGFACEIVVSNDISLASFSGYKLELLGIDVVNECNETLLFHPDLTENEGLFNENGLCKNEVVCSQVLKALNEYILTDNEHEWKSQYVYHVKC